MIVLSIDPSYFSGYAISQMEKFPENACQFYVLKCGYLSMPKKKEWKNLSQGEILVQRVLPFLRLIEQLGDSYHPDHIVWEMPPGAPNSFTARAFGRWDGIALSTSYLLGINLSFVSPHDVKVWGHDSPKTDKEPPIKVQEKKYDVVKAAAYFYPELFENFKKKNRLEAVADAIAIALTFARKFYETKENS